MTIWSTSDAYTALVNRILNYVPTGGNPEMPATSLANGAIGQRCWVLQAPDNATMPYLTLRIASRRPKVDYSLGEAFSLEVDVWNRPRDKAHMLAAQAIADQVQAALIGYAEPTAPVEILGLELRQSVFYATSPADRDVIREQLVFSGFLGVTYVEQEIGSS